MKNAIICGTGKMGLAIGAAMKHLGYKLSIIEQSAENARIFCNCNGDCKVYHHWGQINTDEPIDVFISSLPYHATLDAAVWCIDNGIRYCDLGGSVPVSKDIKEIANSHAKMPVMTDLGLAPGWINIMTEEMYNLLPGVDSVSMMVGGIPPNPLDSDPLKYKITWSMDGLINEYVDDCIVLGYGKLFTVPGLSGLEKVNIHGMDLEAFYTSGASSHTIDVMAERGVSHCHYKTLRWSGHCNLIKYLLDAKIPRDALQKLIDHSSACYKDDMIVLNVIVSKQNTIIKKDQVIYADNGMSAMQKATALPLVAVAHQLANGLFDNKKYPVYSDVDTLSFNKTLEELFSKVILHKGNL